MIRTRRKGDIKLLSLTEAKELSDDSDIIIYQIEAIGSNIKEPWFLVEFGIRENKENNIVSSTEKVTDFKANDYSSCDFGDPDHIHDGNLCYSCNNFDHCITTKENAGKKIYKCTDFH